MAKMCKYFNHEWVKNGKSYCGSPKWKKGMIPSTKAIKEICPPNTGSGCKIIPRREKMVRVKAWFWKCVGTDNNMLMCQNFDPSDMRAAGIQVRPCTILIAAKYLKGGKL